MSREIILGVAFLAASVVLGGFLAGLADSLIGEVIRGTVLGPTHPRTAEAWTVVGFLMLYFGWRRYE